VPEPEGAPQSRVEWDAIGEAPVSQEAVASLLRTLAAGFLDLLPGERGWRLSTGLDAQSGLVGVRVVDTAGNVMSRSAPAGELAPEVRLMDLLQQIAIDHVWEARPVCPVARHQHPLEAALVGNGPGWRCPTGAWSCVVGEYSSSVPGGGGGER
jgi:hypothetical protein